ncbi:MAG: hypothetical protein LBL34_04375 [Clostridiales bacterium]|jgi:hypothetical protein|nr:hypothetical protein [Clostridiales bacterium]
MEKKANFHYYFAFRWLPPLFLEHYDVFKGILSKGPTYMRNFLVSKWEEVSQRNIEKFENVELLNNKSAEAPFDFSLVKRENKADVFSIYMPPMAPPLNAIEALIISVIMDESKPEVFICEYDDYTIQKMKQAGASSEYSEPHFMIEKVEGGKFISYGNCKKFSEFFAKIDEI